MSIRIHAAFVGAFLVLLVSSPVRSASDPAVSCEAGRLKAAARYSSCMLKAEATALLKSTTPVYDTCQAKFDAQCAKIVTRYGAACPAQADCASVRDVAQCAADTLPIPPTTTTTTLPCGAAVGDDDMDGFTEAEGDCDDCEALVNPAAMEVANGVDDDCDSLVDNLVGPCDAALVLDDTDALAAARAIDLCQTTTVENPRWGVLSASYVRANGPASAPGLQAGLMDGFGTNIVPQTGQRMLVLSSGRARTPVQPGACLTESCTNLGAGTPPAGFPQAVPGCPVAGTIYDDMALQVVVRVPTNAVGYRFRLDFYSFEYPEWVCTQYNDQYVSLANPPPAGSINGNLSFEADGTPISVNAAMRVCAGCALGTEGLVGTGFDSLGDAGATGWLVTQAPVDPGSTLTLRFVIWDTGDATVDSTVLLDGFEWITTGPVTVNTEPAP